MMKEKKEKKKWGLIFFIIIIMIGTSISFIYIGFSGVDEKVRYNGIVFVKFSDRWEAKINGKTAAFSFLPAETENIPVQGFGQKLQNKLEIDSTYDFNSTFAQSIALAQHQMSLTLENYNVYLRPGFTGNNSYGIPVITCNDSTENIPVIYFRQSNSTNVKIKGNCVIAEASSNADIIKVKDRIVYGILGVIK